MTSPKDPKQQLDESIETFESWQIKAEDMHRKGQHDGIYFMLQTYLAKTLEQLKKRKSTL